MKTLLPLAAALAACLFSACAPATPEARIRANPAVFESLSPSQQEHVRQGRIARGMSPDAVYLAWGRPAEEFGGIDGAGATRRWDYAGTQPVFISNNWAAYGHGARGRFGHYGPAHGFTRDVVYVPYLRASVWFRNERVDRWEQIR